MRLQNSRLRHSIVNRALSKIAGLEDVIPIKKGDVVKIRPEWRDLGDENYTWVALEDEDGGRVRIGPLGTGLHFQPNSVVRVDMLEPKLSSDIGGV